VPRLLQDARAYSGRNKASIRHKKAFFTTRAIIHDTIRYDLLLVRLGAARGDQLGALFQVVMPDGRVQKALDDTIPNDLLLSYCIRLWKVLWSRARENTDIKIFLVERKRIQQTFLKYTRTPPTLLVF
jgi:hypothetical protein